MLDPDAPTSKIRFRVASQMDRLVVSAKSLATSSTEREALLEKAQSLIGTLRREVEPFLNARRELTEEQRKPLSERQIEQIVHGLRMAEPTTRRKLNQWLDQLEVAIHAIFRLRPMADSSHPDYESALAGIREPLAQLRSTVGFGTELLG